MNNIFKVKIEQYSFDKEGILKLRDTCQHGVDWPVVYILSGNKEAYIGETQSAYNRMIQHLSTKDSLRKNLTRINLIQSEVFNKSAILDIENMLITHMHADGIFILQNANGGQSKLHNYYQRNMYQDLFGNIWIKLKGLNLAKHNLFEVENLDVFKFSPYKKLTNEQYEVVEELLKLYSKAIQQESRIDIVVNGGAGTGKSLIAIYFINVIASILNNNYDYSHNENYIDNESFFSKADFVKSVKKYGNNKICFVVAAPSFKNTVKKIFSSIKELRKIKVLSPSEASRGDYDIIIVDEAHRLKRRNKLTNYGTHDSVNKELNLPNYSTELDWMKMKAKKMLILFYDNKQTVKESDVKSEDFEKTILGDKVFQFFLNTQMRVKGGNEYIDFVNKLFTNTPSMYYGKNEYDIKVFENCHEMFEEIKKKNLEYNGLCRVLSGLSFYWRKKARDKSTTNYKQKYDFTIDGYNYCWNVDFNAGDFITNDDNIDKIGCIYTSQGYDLNFAGVILGEDISYNTFTQKIEYHVDRFIDKNAKSDNIDATINNIINAYKILLTRGIYGTYIYAVDKNLRKYIKTLINKNN